MGFRYPARYSKVGFATQGSTSLLVVEGAYVDTTKPAVVHCHAYTTLAARDELSLYRSWSWQSWLATGHRIFVAYTGANWCHPTDSSTSGGTGLAAIGDARTAAIAAGHPSTVHLSGVSMGGGNCLTYAMRNPSHVDKVHVFVPVHDLGAMWDQVGYRTSIETAWDETSRADVLTAAADYDPAQNVDLLTDIGDKVRIFADRADTVIDWDTLEDLADDTGMTLVASAPSGGYGHIFWLGSPYYDEIETLQWLEAA
jgi:pimeloyl-ACP methyl ester carboxylesterase